MNTKMHPLCKLLISAILLAATTVSHAVAQDAAADERVSVLEQLKESFSPEGRQNWHPEVAVDGHAMIWMGSADLAVGARTDHKRVFGLGVGLGEHVNDALPGHSYYVSAYLWHRHYAHLGKRERFALYSDIRLGAGCYYKSTESEWGDMPAVGSFLPVLRWAPGISLRVVDEFRLNLGPVVGTDILGVHLGLSI